MTMNRNGAISVNGSRQLRDGIGEEDAHPAPITWPRQATRRSVGDVELLRPCAAPDHTPTRDTPGTTRHRPDRNAKISVGTTRHPPLRLFELSGPITRACRPCRIAICPWPMYRVAIGDQSTTDPPRPRITPTITAWPSISRQPDVRHQSRSPSSQPRPRSPDSRSPSA